MGDCFLKLILEHNLKCFISGTICLYRRYIATSVTYIGSVASGTMPSVEACKAACDRDTISDCIGVVYQDNTGKCTKFPDTSHLTKVASADSEFYERHCQFSAGIKCIDGDLASYPATVSSLSNLSCLLCPGDCYYM